MIPWPTRRVPERLTPERIIIVVAVLAAIACVVLVRAGIQKALGRARPAGRANTAGTSARRPRIRWAAPTLLARSDFPHPETPWLLAVFVADNCRSCDKVQSQLLRFQGDHTAVVEISQPELLDRYGVDAVPTVVLADAVGKVSFSHTGPLNRTSLASIASALSG